MGKCRHRDSGFVHLVFDNSLKALLFKLKNDDSFELWVTMESIADRNSLLNFTLQSEKLLRF